MASLIRLSFSLFISLFLFSPALGMSIIITYNGEARSETEVMALYESWLVKHGKVYNALGEKENRFKIFKDNLIFIDNHNSVDRPYKLGMNRFADLTNEEYRSMFVNGRLSRESSSVGRKVSDRYTVRAGEELPENVDWRENGAVAPIKNQGQCGSCWAFSTVAAVEAVNKIVTGDLITLSEQELVDCNKGYNQGCNGGFIDHALKFIIDNGGLDTEDDYPYKGRDTTCDINWKNVHAVSIDSYEQVPENDEQALKKAVAFQPVSVSIDAGGRIFQHYESGIFTGHCGTDLDHAVVVVGYGTEDGKDYWIVRNSWGLDWGETGYIRVERNLANTKNGKCGIAIEPFYPIKKGNNSPKHYLTPPAPVKPSTVCDKYFSCEEGATCCCVYEYKNLCSAWGCCPMESATCCDDQFSCCPEDYPVCDLKYGTCLVRKDNPLGIPAMRRGNAKLSWLGLNGSRRISSA